MSSFVAKSNDLIAVQVCNQALAIKSAINKLFLFFSLEDFHWQLLQEGFFQSPNYWSNPRYTSMKMTLSRTLNKNKIINVRWLIRVSGFPWASFKWWINFFFTIWTLHDGIGQSTNLNEQCSTWSNFLALETVSTHPLWLKSQFTGSKGHFPFSCCIRRCPISSTSQPNSLNLHSAGTLSSKRRSAK